MLWKKFDLLFVSAYNTSFSSLQAYNPYEWRRPLCLTDTQQLGGTFTFTYALHHQWKSQFENSWHHYCFASTD